MDKRYPDLALLAQPARRAICCLAVEGGGEKIEGLLNRKPFSRYAENGLTVLLYDEAQSEVWRAEIEQILAESGLCAGLSGPFALAASARGCFPKARIALETGKTVDPGRALYDMGTYSEAALLRAARTALGAQGFRASDFGDAAIEALARLDERLHSIVISKKEYKANRNEQKMLNLEEGDEVLVLTRLMILDDKPWMIDRATYSAKRYPGFLEQIEDGVSTYSVMREQYGVRMRRAYREITLAYATNEQAKMLGCTPSAPLFKTFKVAYDEQGLPVHMSSTYTQADNVVLTVENGNYRKELIEKQSG